MEKIQAPMFVSQTYVGREDKPFEGSSEYINLSRAWHPGKELPEIGEECLLAFGDHSYSVGHIIIFKNGTWGWIADCDYYSSLEIVQWAYIKDFVPHKLKKGGKQ